MNNTVDVVVDITPDTRRTITKSEIEAINRQVLKAVESKDRGYGQDQKEEFGISIVHNNTLLFAKFPNGTISAIRPNPELAVEHMVTITTRAVYDMLTPNYERVTGNQVHNHNGGHVSRDNSVWLERSYDKAGEKDYLADSESNLRKRNGVNSCVDTPTGVHVSDIKDDSFCNHTLDVERLATTECDEVKYVPSAGVYLCTDYRKLKNHRHANLVINHIEESVITICDSTGGLEYWTMIGSEPTLIKSVRDIVRSPGLYRTSSNFEGSPHRHTSITEFEKAGVFTSRDACIHANNDTTIKLEQDKELKKEKAKLEAELATIKMEASIELSKEKSKIEDVLKRERHDLELEFKLEAERSSNEQREQSFRLETTLKEEKAKIENELTLTRFTNTTKLESLRGELRELSVTIEKLRTERNDMEVVVKKEELVKEAQLNAAREELGDLHSTIQRLKKEVKDTTLTTVIYKSLTAASTVIGMVFAAYKLYNKSN